MSDDFFHQQLPGHVGAAAFDAYVERLMREAVELDRQGIEVLRASGTPIDAAPREDPQLVTIRKKECQRMALHHLQDGTWDGQAA